jgi:hypothetical protein
VSVSAEGDEIDVAERLVALVGGAPQAP